VREHRDLRVSAMTAPPLSGLGRDRSERCEETTFNAETAETAENRPTDFP
jgi:hypothetical protein